MAYFGRKNIEQETERDIGIDFIVKPRLTFQYCWLQTPH
ncbi:Uncharacterised protein [Vibrio cholerae]|nr:Uncharacterised protein [Vibrio cholerae]